MKKALTFVVLIFVLFATTSGCFRDRDVSHTSSNQHKNLEFHDLEEGIDILKNIEIALKNIEVYEMSIDYTRNSDGRKISGDIVAIMSDLTRNASVVADLKLDGSDVKFYMHDETINISYPFSNLNVGIRDSVDNLKGELEPVIDSYHFDIPSIDDFLDSGPFANFTLVDWFEKHSLAHSFDSNNNSYTVEIQKEGENVSFQLDEYFRPTVFNFSNESYIINVETSYPTSKTTLNFPSSLRGVTYVSLQRALSLSKKDSLADLMG